MPTFRYVAYSAEGLRETGEIESDDQSAAWASLKASGLSVAELLDVTSSGPASLRWSISRRRIPLAAQADLADLMAILARAKLPAIELVRLISASVSRPDIRSDFDRMARLLADGKSLTDAFEPIASHYSPLFTSLFGVVQATRGAEDVFAELARALRRQEKSRQDLLASLAYPLLLIAAGLGVLSLISFFLVPRLEQLFSSTGHDLPVALSLFKSFGSALRGLVVTAPLWIVTGLVGVAAIARRPKLVLSLSRRLPVWGPLTLKSSVTRMTRTLHLLLRSDQSLPSALEETAKQFRNEPFANALTAANARLRQGEGAAAALSSEPSLPNGFKEVFRLGERTNSLVEMTGTLAELLEQEVERDTKRLAAALAPALTLGLGILVGTIAYSVMSAILSINDLAN